MTKYNSEKELYPDVIYWLNTYLQYKYPRATIKSYDTSRENLCEFIRRHNLSKYFSESESYVIKVDITGVVQYNGKCLLAFVECKLKSISLKDVSQIIGYSKVAKPVLSLIISPQGISTPVNKLINIYRRYDILTYQDDLKVRIAKWNKSTKDIDVSTLLPHGEHL
ncbi:MAG: hypothetical protein WC179_03895 [Candidatus Cloacimonadaceae bacterium]|jgi:hypothetical protein